MEEAKKTLICPVEIIRPLFGVYDEHMIKLEKAFSVSIVNRGEEIIITGSEAMVLKAESVILKLWGFIKTGENVDSQKINYLIGSVGDEEFSQIDTLNKDIVCMTSSGKAISPKTLGQKKYVECLRKNTVVFGVGPAGTGKTYLAMASAISAFKKNEVSRIILTRPAIEAGEKLGFLPGDLQQKVDPYLRPLYDALYEIMGAETFLRNQEKGLIEVAPLAYMRGRTLDNAYIVLDEAQNTTPEQMKMFLTRIGFGSKVAVTGDITQIDLPEGKTSGLKEALSVLTNIPDISISYLTHKDVVRHPLIQKIIEAYDKAGAQKNQKRRPRTRLSRNWDKP